MITEKKPKTLFKISLVNKWYFILSLLFILMRYLNIINWGPLWLLSPLWLPWAISLTIITIPYILLGIVWIIGTIYDKIKKIL